MEALRQALAGFRAGRLDEARALCLAVLAEWPRQADALYLLGEIERRAGNPAAAVARLNESLALQPDRPAAHNSVGLALAALGRAAEAEAAYLAALRRRPEMPEPHLNLGTLYGTGGRWPEALEHYRKAAAVWPDHAPLHANLAEVCRQLGMPAEAEAAARRAVAADPDYPSGWNSLGLALMHTGRLDESDAAFGRALALRPEHAGTLTNFADLRQRQNRLSEAAALYRRALAVEPGYVNARNNLGDVLFEQGDPEGALAAFGEAPESLADPRIHSNRLFVIQHRPGITAAELLPAHAKFAARHGGPAAAPGHRNAPDPERRLRVGMVSADLRRSPIYHFLFATLASLDRNAIEPVIYSGTAQPDDVTDRIRRQVPLWREVGGMADAALAETIRGDGVDILIDLTGHNASNRLLAFARRPAPVQATWLGYIGTTGLAAIDYLLADAFHVPPGEEAAYAETIVRLPEAYICYTPPDFALAVGPLPAARHGAVTFGCFNRLAKLSDGCLALWGEILRRLPRARLVIDTKALADDGTSARLRERLGRAGCDAGRVDLRPGGAHRAFLAGYGDIDIALDPFPYSGATTTLEAAWMGVPTVTLRGRHFAGRHSACFMGQLGLSELIAEDESGYVERACALAADLDSLAALRPALRGRLAASPLGDGPRFARHFEAALRGMWRGWCAGKTLEQG